MKPMRSSQGFSLIEVLITMFVVAVGLLGIAGLQTFSKKSNFDAVQRTTAAALAQDIIERMRANASAASSYVTDATAGVGATPAAGTDCGSSTCTPAQLQAYDLYKWSQALFGASEVASDGTNAGGLSSPTGCITSSACGLYAITIAWRGVTSLDGADTRTGDAYLCGANNIDYTSADNKPMRRLVVVQTFIDSGTSCTAAASTR